METRRELLKELLGASVVIGASALIESGYPFITVAHSGVNRNGREYEPAAMFKMIQPGTHVFSDNPAAAWDLSRLLGIVTYGRMKGTSAEVLIRWFGPEPFGQFVTPVGNLLRGPAEVIDGDRYEFKYLVVCPSSAFQNAGRIG
jgi:hypothetical protein